uniref:COMM domain-containing protein 6 n=1 Tax=Fundulus heteroclitus TaxID=8078 RepID=A0A3Q2PB67_FUNHE
MSPAVNGWEAGYILDRSPVYRRNKFNYRHLNAAELVDMQWKLGMAVSSDTCRSLNSPYVSLLLKIAEPSGQISQKALEMTIPQFQNFHKQFKEMAAIMETV